MKINLNEIIDPAERHVTISADTKGHRHARFDLQGLPRVGSLLVDKSTAEAFKMIERLYGLCPVAHHLAGIRTLDGLVGIQVKSYAEMVHHLSYYGSMIEVHSLRFTATNRETGVALKQFPKQMLAGTGSPDHFPNTTTPGGIQVEPKLEDLQAVADGLEMARAAA